MVSAANIDAGGAGFKLSLKDTLTDDLQASLSGAVKTIKGVRARIDKEVKAIGTAIQSTGKKIAGVGLGVGAFGSGLTLGLAKATVAAGDFAETVNMFDAVFKDQSAAVREWGDNYAKTVGRSREQLMRFLAESQDTFVPLGFDRTEAAELSKTITKLAIDLGSFKNIDDDDALRRLLGGVIGNTENLRAFGVVAQEAQIKAKALTLGFDPSNLTAYQKAMAILQITIDGTADAQGDAVRTAGSFNNQLKAMSASFADLKNAIGGPLLQIGTEFIRGITSAINSINSLLTQFPALSKGLAGIAFGMGAVGAAAAGVGTAIALMGKSIATGGIIAASLIIRANGMKGSLALLTGVIGQTKTAVLGLNRALAANATAWRAGASGASVFGKSISAAGGAAGEVGGILTSAFAKGGFRAIVAGIGTGIRGMFRLVRFGVSGLVKFITFAFKGIAKVVMRPIALIPAIVAGGLVAARKYYEGLESKAKEFGEILEKQRQEIVAQSFRDAGQAVPSDLGKRINDYSNARVAPDQPAGISPLTESQRELIEEISGIKSALESYRERIQAAVELLKRGEISQAQFGKFVNQEMENFKANSPAIQARESLIEQLKTPTERFREAVENARKLFADDAQMLGRAIEDAAQQFRATDPAMQLAQQLRTPAEILRDSIREYRELLQGQPELLRRAIAAAVGEYREATKEKETDETRSAKKVTQGAKTDAEKAGEQIAKATALASKGLIGKDTAKKFAANVRKDLLENLAEKAREQFPFKSAATRSANIAANIGKYAPSFSNTASEEKTYRKKQLELQKATADELRKISRRSPVFI